MLNVERTILLFYHLPHHHIFIVPYLHYIDASWKVADVDLCLRFGYGLGDELLAVGVGKSQGCIF